jgi:hypothetical protein
VALPLKVENKLTASDLENLAFALEDKLVKSIELLPELEYESIDSSPLVVKPQEGYLLTVDLGFHDPIAGTVCSILRIEERGLQKTTRTIEMRIRRSKVDPQELTEDISYSCSLIEKVVNYTCTIRNESIHDVLSISSEQISRQLRRSRAERERSLRGEEIKMFGVIHAGSGLDFEKLPDDLVPFYAEYDRFDLYGGGKVYRLLPRTFVSKILKCQGDLMISESDFNKNEIEILETLVKKHQIKKRKIAGKYYYFSLDDATKRYLYNALKRKKFRK